MQLFKKDIHINFRQPKYVFPAFLYLPLLLVGYAIQVCSHLQRRQRGVSGTIIFRVIYLRQIFQLISEIRSQILEDQYGMISDSTAMNSVENDNDSVNKKLDYQSRYSGRDLEQLQQQQNDQRELQQLRAMQNRVQRNTSAGGGDFSSPISESDIKRVQHRRRQNALSQMEDDLYGDDSDDAMKKLYESYGLDANGNPLPNRPRKGTGNGNSQNEGGQPTSSIQDVRINLLL